VSLPAKRGVLPVKLAVIGSRGFSDYQLLSDTLHQRYTETDSLGACRWRISEIISGAAKGADQMAARFAREHSIALTELPADWETHGKRAGFLRNQDIVAAADEICAFWGVGDDGELSRGTGHSLSIAKRLRKTSLIIYV
jgi:hypothetical protein